TASHQHLTELFSSFGECGVAAERVADQVATQARHYLDSGAAVGEHLADQLLLPMALAGGGSFTTHIASSHLHSNIAVIEKFLPVEITVQQQANGLWRLDVDGEAVRRAAPARVA
ncbi:RNA 3'-terminal phosphate cyclase, partial [Chitinimonas sp.]|uniref:RNA 3'-terminal phosphate cyclase n=1 Tax=Chitinimonas sp. TaxID=1934313 RepID=UPI0035B1E824